MIVTAYHKQLERKIISLARIFENHVPCMMVFIIAMMQRMQQQMSSLWGALLNRGYAMRPRPPVEVVEPLVPVETPAVVDEKSVIKIDELPANYTNTTSETKEIDGHVVEVNKTIHKITSNDSSGFFHFQVSCSILVFTYLTGVIQVGGSK